MITAWTSQQISSVLLQLEQRNLPFPGYTFRQKAGLCQLLGSGSFALVFDAEDKTGRNNCCIKVVGFGDRAVDPENFRQAMESQVLMSCRSANVLKVYKYVQLYVRLDENDQVVDAAPLRNDAQRREDCLLLQFAVMEKLTPVLSIGRNRQPVLFPQKLAEGDEKEVLRLAEQMVNALTALHNNKILHRDIKLENIFYDSRHKRYKLGDFGCAKATIDGLANTVAFTKGYGAPEIVGMSEDRYDCTADIYSLGMVLFVLLNDLRFPDSDRYHVNPAAQYCLGYLLPDPAFGSEAVAQLLRKMCAYDPDDRPQSMQEISKQLDWLGFSPDMRSRGKDGNLMALLGTVFLTAGSGILLLRSGYPDCRAFFDTIPWLSPLLLSLGVTFLCQAIVFVKNRLAGTALRQIYSKLIWGGIVVLYIGLIIVAKLPPHSSSTISHFFEVTVPGVIRQLQGDKIGIFGLIICGLWWLRDRARTKK